MNQTRATFIAIVCMAVAASSLGQPPSPGAGSNVLTIVVDTSSSCSRFSPEFRTLALQAASALDPGDYFEVIVAGPSRPQLRLAQTIRTGNTAELKHIEAVLAGISARWLTDASVPNALEMARARLAQMRAQRRVANVTTIVLTDGRVHSDEVDRILATADRFRANGWSLFMTGTGDATRELLVAANKGRLTWSLIGDTNPGLWLAKEENAHTSPVEKRQEEPEEPNSPSKGSATVPDKSQEVASNPQPVQQTRGAELTFSGKISGVRLPLPAPDVPGGAEVTPPETSDRPAPEPNAPPKPTGEEVGEQSSDEDVGSESSSGVTLARALRRSGPWIIASLLLSGLIAVAVRAQIKAHEWTQKTGAAGRTKAKEDPGILRVTSNGQHYDLGPLERFHHAHVGKGEGNAIRLSDDSLEKQHVLLFSKRHGVYVQNTAKSPIRVNGAEVKPRGSRRLSFPADIDLSGRTKVRLTAEKKPADSAKERRASDDNPE